MERLHQIAKPAVSQLDKMATAGGGSLYKPQHSGFSFLRMSSPVSLIPEYYIDCSKRCSSQNHWHAELQQGLMIYFNTS
jgi:hypothetical protein